MPILQRMIIIVLVLVACQAARAASCHDRAIEDLQRLYPAGFQIYAAIRRKADFLHWVTCEDVQLGLVTAVHESVHQLTSEIDAYPLISGARLPRVEASDDFFPPHVLAPHFNDRSMFVSIYLRKGEATSAIEFGYLLDELNAYTHDLTAAVSLQRLAPRDRHAYHRDGLAALMAFVAKYVEEARLNHPLTWRRLQQQRVRGTVAGLWAQAESAMGGSCQVPDIGEEAPDFLGTVCRATFAGGIGQLLGRPPLCPVRCTRSTTSSRAN